MRVPAYSPHAVAEFTVGLILTLNRQIHRAYNRTRENNFALDGLLGFDLFGKTVGVIGTGKIVPWSRAACGSASAARCWPTTSPIPTRLVALGVRYLPLDEVAAARRHPHPPLPADPADPAPGRPAPARAGQASA